MPTLPADAVPLDWEDLDVALVGNLAHLQWPDSTRQAVTVFVVERS